jgi:hypothetical protein
MVDIDPELLARIRRALTESDAVIVVRIDVQDAYVMSSTLGMACRHPALHESMSRQGFEIAKRIEDVVCDKTGVPRAYQLSEHVENEIQCAALLKKHFKDAQPIDVNLSPGEAFSVVGLLQVATRHEEIPPGIYMNAIAYGRAIQTGLSQTLESKEVYEVLEAGWDPENDQ